MAHDLTDMSWFDQEAWWRDNLPRIVKDDVVVVEVPRLAGRLEQLEAAVIRLTEAIRAATPA